MTEQYERPSPDHLLQIIKEEEEKKSRKRGHLKIFLGYIAGVGKTYKMISEAHTLKKKGHDVVAGIIETHGRSETEELLKGLNSFPRKKVEYGGILLEELDIDRILEEKPEFVLIDELAHTNVPGSRHTKRYYDVEEIIDEGINVYTTLNIQHIEGLNDIIYQITGIDVKETVPDRVIEIADKIEIIDLPTEELLQRLKEGKIYLPEKAKQASEKFFKERTLLSLRELTLRYATKLVDFDVKRHLEREGISGPWEVSNKIMVAIDSKPSSENIIRQANRVADNLNAEWITVYVEPSYDFKRGVPFEDLQLEKNLNLAEELGSEIFKLSGTDIAEEIVSFAKLKNINFIIIGRSERSRIRGLIHKSVPTEVIQKSKPIHVIVVEKSNEKNMKTLKINKNINTNLKSYLKPLFISFSSMILTLIICIFIQPFVDAINIPMIFIIPILFSALISGRKGGILSSIIAVAFFNFFFVDPYYTFSVGDIRFIITFIVLFIVGIITSFLADTVKKQVKYTRQREEFIATLYDFSKNLLISSNLDEFVERITNYIHELFNYDVVILLPDDKKNLKNVSTAGKKVEFFEHDFSVAKWVFTHGKSAGYNTDTLSSSKWYYLPLKTRELNLGVLAVDPNKSKITTEQKHILESFTNIVSITLVTYIKGMD